MNADPLEKDLPKLYIELFECFSNQYFAQMKQFLSEIDNKAGELVLDRTVMQFKQEPAPFSLFSTKKKDPFQTVPVSIRPFVEYKFVCKNIFKTARFERKVGANALPAANTRVIAPLLHFVVNDISESDYAGEELVDLTTNLLRVFRWCAHENLNFKLYLALLCDDVVLALVRGICEKNGVELAPPESGVEVADSKEKTKVYVWTLAGRRAQRDVEVVFEIDSAFTAKCSIREIDPKYVFLGGARIAF
jgi:hypothetical protein